MRRMVPHVRAPVRFLIYLRFARYLLWEFRWPLGVFTMLVLGGGWILHRFYDHGQLRFARACHAVFLLIFLESSLDFPERVVSPAAVLPAAGRRAWGRSPTRWSGSPS